jgi:hypothetical protein
MQRSIVFCAASLLAVGCGSTKKEPTTDGSVGKPDKGKITIPDGGGVEEDTGVTPGLEGGVVPGDQGTPQSLSCLEIIQCISKCGETDQTCFTGCINQGSTDGQAKFDALLVCMEGAVKGSCAASCTDPAAKACADCWAAACQTQVDACQGGGGTGTKTCGQVLQCGAACGTDQACVANCISQGTAEAQTLIKAMAQCFNTAAAGTCATPCANQQSQECQTCLSTECKTEMDACI